MHKRLAFVCLLSVFVAVVFPLMALGAKKEDGSNLKSLMKKADKGDAAAQYELGLVYLRGDKVKKDAPKGLSYVIKAADQNYRDALNVAGYLYLNGVGTDANPSKALVYFQKAAEAGDPWGYANLGVLYANGSGVEMNLEKARAYFQKAVEIDASSEAGQMAKTNMEKMEMVLTAVNKADELEKQQKYLEASGVYLEYGMYGKALEMTDKNIHSFPTDLKGYLTRGEILNKMGKKDEALAFFSKTIELFPNSEELYVQKAELLDNPQLRIPVLTEALRINPNNADALWLLGWIYREDDQKKDEAISLLNRLAVVDPKYDERVYRFLAVLYLEKKPPQCEVAIQNRRKANELLPSEREHGFLADTLAVCEKYDQAQAIYREMLKKEESYFEAYPRDHYFSALMSTYMGKNGISLSEGTFPAPLDEDEKIELKSVLTEIYGALKDYPPCATVGETDADGKPQLRCSEKHELLAYAGAFHQVLGEDDKAIQSYQKAQIAWPNYSLSATIGGVYFHKKDYVKALKYCKESVASHGSNDKFGNFQCSDNFIERITIKKAEAERLEKIRKSATEYIKLYAQTFPKGLNCSYNIHEVNGLGTLSLTDNIFVSYTAGEGINEVRLPVYLSEQLNQANDEKTSRAVYDTPFFVWFSEAVVGTADPEESMGGLCYLNHLAKRDEHQLVAQYIKGFLVYRKSR